MKLARFINELEEGSRIAAQQIYANKLRSMLTALGIIIGIIAVTLMGTAIHGIDLGFDQSMGFLGDDVFYVQRQPWFSGRDWMNFRSRPSLKIEYAEQIEKIAATTPDSQIEMALPECFRIVPVKKGDTQLNREQLIGGLPGFLRIHPSVVSEGRFFNESDAMAGSNVCVVGFNIYKALFPNDGGLEQIILVDNKPFRLIGFFIQEGSFLGNGYDDTLIVPLSSFRRQFNRRQDPTITVKVKDKARMVEARDELTGIMRRVRHLSAGKPDDFSINQSQALKDYIDPIKTKIALAGLFITGLALFVGAIGIMNITYVSVKERTGEIGMRKALGARRQTILLQFLLESVSICLLGGIIGLVLTYGICLAAQSKLPSFPIDLSFELVFTGMIVSTITGILSGFAPAWSASRLDPIVALRYE